MEIDNSHCEKSNASAAHLLIGVIGLIGSKDLAIFQEESVKAECWSVKLVVTSVGRIEFFFSIDELDLVLDLFPT